MVHSRFRRRFTHPTTPNIFTSQNHHQKYEGLVFLVSTTPLFYFSQQCACCFQADIFWRNAWFRDCLGTIYRGCRRFGEECQRITRRPNPERLLALSLLELVCERTFHFRRLYKRRSRDKYRGYNDSILSAKLLSSCLRTEDLLEQHG
jgi:hypothetical protein